MEPDQIQINGSGNKNATVQFKKIYHEEDNKLSAKVKSEFGDNPQINTVSPLIGQELAKNAVTALILASIGIIIYVSLRFEWRMGLSSVLALLHDVFIIIAIFSLF